MPEHRDREHLRETFGSVAELYDRARPEYPDVVFDDLAELALLEPGSRVLEIGPGTGKATAELARRGYAVTGVELSPELAEIARRNVPEAEIEVAEFESWEPEQAGFDAVVAFAAFHWIAPELRYPKTTRLLRPGGALAVIHGPHVSPEDGDPFFAEAQEDYDAVVPHPENGPPPRPWEVESWEPEQAGFDAVVAFAAFHWIAPELRYAKTTRLLRPGGTLAVIHGPHVSPEDGDPFFAEVQEDYDAVVPHPENGPPPRPWEVESWADEFRASGLFGAVEERKHLHSLTYTADEYVAVLGTFSDNLALREEQRHELFSRIHARIATRPEGTVTKHHLLVLTVGYRQG